MEDHYRVSVPKLINQLRLEVSGFDAEAYWADKEFKKWVVALEGRKSVEMPSGKIKRIKVSDFILVQARTEERAIATAKRWSFMKGRIYCKSCWLARPEDLGATVCQK